MKTTLVAVSGMSPAIITETLWELASEVPPVTPDDVVVITTSKGKADIDAMLLTPNPEWMGKSVWETLRTDILRKTGATGKLQLSVRVIDLPDEPSGVRRPAEDLRSRADNDEAADFIVRTLAEYCDAHDVHVIASIAGGRKTMGALLYAAMSLVGKEGDRVTHVLVSEPFENCRGFFYPEQPVQNLEARPFGQALCAVRALDAKIELANIPFVPLRNKFTELNEPRRTFAGLVSDYARADQGALKHPPEISLTYRDDLKTIVFHVGKRSIELKGRELLAAAFLYDRLQRGAPHFQNKDEAAEELALFMEHWRKEHPGHQATARLSAGTLTPNDFPNALNGIRKKLSAAGMAGAIPYLAPPGSRIGFDAMIS